MKKRYSYRAYPTTGQERILARVFGCARYVYNWFLQRKRDAYKYKYPAPSLNQLSHDLTLLKKEPGYEWLGQVSAVPLQQSLRHANAAYAAFYKSMNGERKGPRVGLPRFKKRIGEQTAEYTRAARFKVRRVQGSKWGIVRLPIIGDLKFKWSRDLPSDPSSLTVIKRPSGRYEVSFVVDVTPRLAPAPVHEEAGVDLGLGTLAVIRCSDGYKLDIPNPRFLQQAEHKLRKLDQSLARKQKGSKNYEATRLARARAYEHLADTRLDFLFKLARRLIDENQAIALETLNISGLAKSRLGKHVLDAGWGTLVRLITELGTEAGRDVRRVSQWYASTQLCCVCHVKDKPKPLSVREWVCPACGAVLDRDGNAAVNIMLAAGLAESLNACGGVVNRALASPSRLVTPVKQEPTETNQLH